MAAPLILPRGQRAVLGKIKGRNTKWPAYHSRPEGGTIMQEQKKHLIFSDIYGTLLDSMHRMPRGVAAAARRAEQKGIPFILISARMPKSIREIRAEMGLCSPYVAYSGALALDGTGTVLFEERIQADAAPNQDA